MKEGWTYKKLGEVANIIAGQSPQGKSYNDKGEGIEFHQGKKAFGKYIIESSNVWTTEITKLAEDGDILMSVRAPVGPTNITDRQICIGRGLAAIRCKELKYRDYILYFLKYIEKNIETNEGAVFNSINKTQIEDLRLNWISQENEMQGIVQYLDAAFAQIDQLKANADKQLSEVRALFQKALAKAMEPKEGWQEKTLGDIANIIHGKNQKDVIDVNGKYPIYGSGGNVMGYAREFLCDANTTILGRKGSINNPYFIKEPFWNVDTAFGINAKEKNNNKFVYYFVSSIDWWEKNTGTTLPSLTQQVVKSVPLSVPPLSDQQRIVDYLDTFSQHVCDLEDKQRKISAECDALKQAILRQVFE